jgi:hypothetical protein
MCLDDTPHDVVNRAGIGLRVDLGEQAAFSTYPELLNEGSQHHVKRKLEFGGGLSPPKLCFGREILQVGGDPAVEREVQPAVYPGDHGRSGVRCRRHPPPQALGFFGCGSREHGQHELVLGREVAIEGPCSEVRLRQDVTDGHAGDALHMEDATSRLEKEPFLLVILFEVLLEARPPLAHRRDVDHRFNSTNFVQTPSAEKTPFTEAKIFWSSPYGGVNPGGE